MLSDVSLIAEGACVTNTALASQQVQVELICCDCPRVGSRYCRETHCSAQIPLLQET